MSAFASLDKADFWQGLALAVAVAVFGALKEAITGDGFSIFTYDWAHIADIALNAGIGYLAIMFTTDKDGKLMGVVKIK